MSERIAPHGQMFAAGPVVGPTALSRDLTGLRPQGRYRRRDSVGEDDRLALPATHHSRRVHGGKGSVGAGYFLATTMVLIVAVAPSTTSTTTM
jgi:hypothetical protein